MSSQQLAGQLVIYSYAGTTVPDALLQQIRAGQAAGVLFFGDNITSDGQIASVIQQLKQAQQQSPVAAPLLLMTDQEGGLVRRLPGEPTQSEKQIGQSANPAAAASQAGTAAGQNLAGVGMNVNLAPVLDVFRQPGDFTDQFQRSYSQNPQTVADCGQAFITAQQRVGVAATAKHFPGLGSASASQNTDAVPVTLPVSLSALRSVDEAPYPAAITAGVKLIMLSWAVYPALDANRPAGLSATVVQGELRGRLGFQGVTITDAIEAGALGAYGSDEQRSVLAAQAGMDLILCAARDVNQGIGVTAALAAALDGGQLNPTDFNGALQRVTALRTGFADSIYFPQTGHSLSHGFLRYWQQFGGLPIFGYPITEEYTDPQTHLVTQYFERARFEWHPGAWPSHYDVELGLLGVELAQKQGLTTSPPFKPIEASNDANCTFYSATGHRLCFGFRDYWQSHGGLAIFGYPISEEFRDSATGLTVQYFERQRLEYHPENPPAWQVEGGLLGDQLVPPGH
jgi:beta-N-acetylhexosaminidase